MEGREAKTRGNGGLLQNTAHHQKLPSRITVEYQRNVNFSSCMKKMEDVTRRIMKISVFVAEGIPHLVSKGS